MGSIDEVRERLGQGLVIPACPLALNRRRKLDDRRQRALFRYYIAAGAGGLAVGVHTTQFAIRDPKVGLFGPVLELAIEELRSAASPGNRPVAIGGICGRRKQAVREAALVRGLGFDAGLLSLAGLSGASDKELLEHCRAVAEIIPVVGFYLQPAVGGRLLSCSFWRRFAEIQGIVAIKIAPFNRYQTLDVIRAVAESGRRDIALYTGNDDNIVLDLLTPFRFRVENKIVERRIVGGLLGQWAVWTRQAVQLHQWCRRVALEASPIPTELLRRAGELTEANAAIFDAAHGYAGCIPGIHEVLRRQGLLEGNWCLDPRETLSPGQRSEIERVHRAYPHLNDDAFVARHLVGWMTN
ncbi:MAG TPA: dihydrodipicolinate synthase family protein [Verrucomicrobiae bacterium]